MEQLDSWGWREEYLSPESPALGQWALLWGLGGPKACTKALSGRALWSKTHLLGSRPRAGLGVQVGLLLPPLELF